MEKKKNKLQIIIPIIIAIILVIVFIYLDSRENDNNVPVEDIKYELLEPISKDENPLRIIEIQPDKMWGCASPETIKPETIKEPDKEWIISRTGAETKISLGKYRIINLSKTILEIPKIWLYFFSNELGRKEDNMYALEKSFVKGISLVVNGQERKLNLGGDKYMFIELDDYPFGDIYPYDKKIQEFEFLPLVVRNLLTIYL